MYLFLTVFPYQYNLRIAVIIKLNGSELEDKIFHYYRENDVAGAMIAYFDPKRGSP